MSHYYIFFSIARCRTNLNGKPIPRGCANELDNENEEVSVADHIAKNVGIWVVSPRYCETIIPSNALGH